MDYEPNVQGAVWLAKEVWPLVRRAIPDAELKLVGARPTTAVQRLAALPGVSVTGTVPDVRPFLWSSRVAFAPLFTARGLHNKVLEALAAGLPTVVTPAVAEGLPEEVRSVCVIGSDAVSCADAAISALRELPTIDPARVLQNLSWDARLAKVPRILEATAV
jgi:glycosyltransferase involved in cell wall biosynthesis